MKNHKLFKTNLVISIVLIIGFVLTAVFSYRANYQASLDRIEQVSSLTSEGIYYRLTTMFAKPVNISLTMAHDSLLAEHLQKEGDNPDPAGYIDTTRTYLETYRKKYGFDSVFLVSTATGNYYNFDGLDRVLTREDPENEWYYRLLDDDSEYTINIDNDEVKGADNDITVFVNCKVQDTDGTVLGVVGVGIRIDYLKELLAGYENKYGIEASLVSSDGYIQISTTYTGYEHKDWFEVYGQENIREQILGWKKDRSNLELWSSSDLSSIERSYIVTRYIPELSWSLIIEQNTGRLAREIHRQVCLTGFILAAVILIVLIVITTVIKNFNRQITELMEERQAVFKRATEELYDNIYEFNITRNCYVGKRTEEYFESLGAKGFPYDEGLRVIAEKQIKEEYREGYVKTFSPQNVMREYDQGNNHLRYDFMITQDGRDYYWMRIDAYVFYSAEDDSLHMFTYRKNIDEERKREIQALTDGMTGFLTRTSAERFISSSLSENPGERYAFFIFDIDNFKQANDCFGHVFGDLCIRRFTEIIRDHFRKNDILGRIGGDEFAAFIQVPDESWVNKKAEELSAALNTVCISGEARWEMSASIGVAISPEDGTDFDTLYQNADGALYQTKQRGKNGFTVRH
ncbi:sensor domain-containing diguanylate cyclase [Clostridium sp. AM58-1XD]|uniref:sensor domain-containing diguanylate cyclase n=1 Tax=Clostridium sp. AM58-1XD TaxID=2292307 RepID=UPI000E4FC3E2|nr:sensor domain-containing diguanylate cyclase [Clostridium sp. AM58-1XD]RGY99685.1 GGDEF domain-containing protein [Clostridium sp. AM58-1XD]